MALARSRSIVDCARVQTVTFLLTKTLSRSRSVVWCVVCVCGVVFCVCACGVCGVVFIVVVRVCGVAWKLGTLSLSLSFSFPFGFPFFFSLSLFLFSLSLFSSRHQNTMERTDQPTRRPTSRHLNVIWRESAQQSVLSLLLSSPLLSSSKKRGNF